MVNTQVTQFEVALPEGENRDSQEQFTVSPPQTEQRLDPHVLQERADKYAFGIGMPQTDIVNQIQAGGEEFLRKSVLTYSTYCSSILIYTTTYLTNRTTHSSCFSYGHPVARCQWQRSSISTICRIYSWHVTIYLRGTNKGRLCNC